MATENATPAPHVAPGSPYITLSPGMQAFYARRGMWADGEPRGMLAAWLGPHCPWRMSYRGHAHWTTVEGLRALTADAIAAPPQAWPSSHQQAQFLRRLREAATRAGVALHATDGQAQGAAVSSVRAAPPVPLESLDLHLPPSGTRAREAFERHVMRTVRDFVDFTQSAAYTEEGLP